jgi:hypothetical protein
VAHGEPGERRRPVVQADLVEPLGERTRRCHLARPDQVLFQVALLMRKKEIFHL